MIDAAMPVLQPFILSWNLRNSIQDPSKFTPEEPSIVGTTLGEYPINGWNPYYLEVSREGHKQDVTGRFNNAVSSRPIRSEWERNRVISLPLYSHIQDCDLESLKTIIKNWHYIGIPEDVPCIALAVKCSGFYSDYREAKYITVITIWNDAVARIISLDWFEGPLEDCITPEWYAKNTPLLNIRTAFSKIQDIYKDISWDNKTFSICTIPQCLGNCLRGTKEQASYKPWQFEWKYDDYSELKTDLSLIFSHINTIFSEDRQEVEIYG